MTPSFRLALAASCLVLSSCAKEDKAVARTIAGFSTPESVLHDAEADVYLVSNISGDPFGHDGDGFISRVSPDGKVLDLRWIDGKKEGVHLDAPKGLALSGDLLWVADIDQLRAFDRKTGAPRKAIAIPGATFLNDVCTDEVGTIYVSDSGFGPGFSATGTDAIWAVKLDGDKETVAALARGDALAHPNGLGISPHGDLFCIDWAKGRFTLIAKDGKLDTALQLPATQLDGLVRRADGHWLASSWEGKCVYDIAPKGEIKVLFEGLEQPADLGIDLKRSCLLVPLFGANEVRVVPL
ncbi:MAG: hypothetical protein U1F36_02350 [Planctomycetota bacterium]